MTDLARMTCVPCRGGIPALKGKLLRDLAKLLPEWKVVKQHHLTRSYDFPDFRTALDYVDRLGAIAEQQGHHPDILLGWGKVGVTVWTHKVDGLTESDFILAAKAERLYKKRKPGR